LIALDKIAKLELESKTLGLAKQIATEAINSFKEERSEENNQIALVAWWNSKGDRYRETVLIEDAVKEFNNLSEAPIYYTPNGNICVLKCSKSKMNNGECVCHNQYILSQQHKERMYSEEEMKKCWKAVIDWYKYEVEGNGIASTSMGIFINYLNKKYE
jgi:hypothetical protein